MCWLSKGCFVVALLSTGRPVNFASGSAAMDEPTSNIRKAARPERDVAGTSRGFRSGPTLALLEAWTWAQGDPCQPVDTSSTGRREDAQSAYTWADQAAFSLQAT